MIREQLARYRLGARLAGLARRTARHAVTRLGNPRVSVVFHAGYMPPDVAIVDRKRAPKILEHLFAEGWLAPRDVLVPRPLELPALLRVHDPAYLEWLDVPENVALALGGVDTPSAAIASGYLAAQRWATAGTVLAARRARARDELVVNLGGGFHHAERARGGGFCLFHDVGVALEDLRSRGFKGRALVLDLDLHHGDGTRSIYGHDPLVACASVHAAAWDDSPAPSAVDLALGPGVGDATYLAAVREALDRSLALGEPDLVFYIAGVDVALDDALGSWRVGGDALFARDRLVLERFRGKPTVMLLAGGYGPEAWRHSARTVAWALSGRDQPIPASHDADLRRVRRVARTFGTDQLSGSATGADDFGITDADLYGDLLKKATPGQLLGFYTPFGLELAFERYGLYEHLRRRGYNRVRLDLDLRSGSGEAVAVRSDDERRALLIEVVLRETREVVPHRLLSLEWLLMQDPLARPTAERPLLPGQQHPGLGGLRILMGMLSMAAERLRFDGLTFVPAHYHSAAQARGILRFLDPEAEARFVAMKQALGARPLLDATRLVAEGKLVDRRTGAPFRWKPARMVIPFSPALRAAVEGEAYDRRVEEAVASLSLARCT